MTMTGSAMLAGVIGWPVTQSLSPRLHGSWIREHGLDAAYVPLGVRPEDFSAAVHALSRMGFRGVNVTVPHKEAAFALAHRHDKAAKQIGAANLLLFGTDGITVRNTDAYGLGANLRETLGENALAGRAAVVWGAGGTARAAIVALAELGAAEIRILNRTKSRAEALARELHVLAKLAGLGFESWGEAGRDAALLVQATGAGMKSEPSLDLPLDILPAGAAVCDVVYNPLETGLLERARARGLRTVDGLGMLMHQAVPSFTAFFGIEPKVTPALRRHLEEALTVG